MASKNTIKQGSVMEGIFAMYCAAFLIDPTDGKNKKGIENFIDDLRVDTTLGKLIDQKKKSVDYRNTFPAHSAPAKKHFSPITIVRGTKAKTLIKDSEKYKTLSKVLKNNELNLIDGPHVKRLEKEICKIFGKKYALMVNSGSSANLLGLSALNFKKGSEIIGLSDAKKSFT